MKLKQDTLTGKGLAFYLRALTTVGLKPMFPRLIKTDKDIMERDPNTDQTVRVCHMAGSASRIKEAAAAPTVLRCGIVKVAWRDGTDAVNLHLLAEFESRLRAFELVGVVVIRDISISGDECHIIFQPKAE
jgi:hypothetical protein